MAAKKTFEIAFQIGAKIASSFGNGFKQANKQLNDMQSKTKDLKKNLEGLQGVAQKGLMLGGAGLAGAGLAVNEAIKFESAMADVKKVFSGTDAELKALNNEIIDMSTRLPMAANDIAKIAASAGQAGIATKEIAAFTESAVKMGVAFDISAEEAGQSMAEMRTAFKMNQEQVVSLADKINYLGNNTPAAAKGIMEIVQRIGPLGDVAGVASGSIAALGATMRGMGVQEEIAATGIKNTMLALVAGKSATKSQQAAFSKLGLESTAVAKAMQKDSEKTVLTVLKGISKLDKYEQASTLANLFGKESLSAIAPLLSNIGELEKNLNMVGDATKYAGSMEAEYAARAATTENQMILAKNTTTALAIELGSTLLPYVNKGLKAFQGIIQSIREWAKANPGLSSALLKTAVVISALLVGIGGFTLALTMMAGPLMTAIKIVFFMAKAFVFLGRAFLMNPIGLAITAIIAAIYLLYTNWDTVVKYVGIAWDAIKGFFTSGIGNIVSTIVNFSPFGLFYSAFSKVLSWFGIDLPSKFTDFGRNLLQGLANGIRNGVSAAVNAAGEAVNAVKNKVKDFFGIHSPSRVFAEFGMYNMQGLANGMTQNTGTVEKASTEAVSSALPSGQSLTSNTSNMSSNFTVNLTVQGGGDSGEQAKQGVMSAWDEIQARNNRNKRTSFA